MYEPDLPLRERRTRGGNHVFYAHLVHTDHVHISFHQETAILFHDCLLGEIDAVKLVAFMINLAFGGVYVLRGLLVLFQYTSAECHDLSA